MGLASSLLGELGDRGWLVAPHPIDVPLEAFARRLGEPIPSRPGRGVVDELRVVQREHASPGTASFVHGAGEFPWHTDAANWPRPPAYLVMRLAASSTGGRPTLLLPLHRIGLTVEDGSMLRRSVYRAVGLRHPFLTTLLSDADGRPTFRYDPDCLVPAAPAFQEAQEALERRMSGGDVATHRWQPGQVLVLDNRVTAHARSGVVDATDAGRVLERVYVRASAE